MSCLAKSPLPFVYTEAGTGEPIEKDNLVEFRLLYEGTLLSSGNHSAVENKHHVRRELHPQLRRLWWEHYGLRQLAAHRGNQANPRQGADERERFDAGITAMAKDWPKCNFQFVPLIGEDSAVRCSLDILLLRPEGEHAIVGPNGPTGHSRILRHGDIDGQLKTLLDALTFPVQPSEIRDLQPQADENPMFCLLSDDKLVSEVNVKAEALLLLPSKRQVNATDAFVIITVKANHRTARTFDKWFD
jgi:hypothetical protein